MTETLTTVELISTVRTVVVPVAVSFGWQAGVIGAQETFTLGTL